MRHQTLCRPLLPSLRLLLAVVSVVGVVHDAACTAETQRPNIVFLLCDDLGYGDVGCFGQKKIRTPNIDRLAAGGMRLTVHYSGNAVCAPSRCTLMTGKHPGHAFIRSNRQYRPDSEGQWPLPAGEVTLPKLLKSLG